MNVLKVPFLQYADRTTDMGILRDCMRSVALVPLMEVPWPAFPYLPDVHFHIAHTQDSIVLGFVVREAHVKAEYRNSNDPVYKDSCVEFFLSVDGVCYYNLEFNCLGVGLIGHGNADKSLRRILPVQRVEEVRSVGRLQADRGAVADIKWELLLNIPFTVFDADCIDSLHGKSCKANFFKCGDDLAEPHFVSWNRIDAEFPNFHLPQFFGELVFE